MKKFVISDIHGSYNEFVELLRYSKFDINKDSLYVLGDMIDRGPDSGKVLKLVRGLQKESELVKVIMGNHEEMMLWYLDEISPMWMQYGGVEGANSINKEFEEEGIEGIVTWLRGLPLILEDKEYIYTHAGILSPIKSEYENRDILWNIKDEFYDIPEKTLSYYIDSKKIIHGHTPDEEVTFDGIRLSIDLGAQVADYPKLALVELEEFIYYEYDFETKTIYKKEIQKI